MHNLKNIDVDIPKNKLVVITGLSGSGKSSLAFDTLFAEGQRRYVESLSSYARQFLGRLDKPDVDMIKGISPAIAIEQKVSSSNPRSTVGTSTEIYDYMRLLFARIGITYSPISGEEVKRHTSTDILNYIHTYKDGEKLVLLAPFIIPKGRSFVKQVEILGQQGFTRFWQNGEMIDFEDAKATNKDTYELLIDRIVVKKDDEDNDSRILDSIQTAFYEGHGECIIEDLEGNKTSFSNKYELDGMLFEEPSDNFFSFNSPMGACPTCEGFGSVIGIDQDLVIPDKSISIYDDAIVCWKGEKMSKWKRELIYAADESGIPIHKPYHELTAEQKELVWTGNKDFKGLNKFFKYLESKLYKIQYRVMLSRYRGKTACEDCKGARIRKDASYVKIDGKSIHELLVIPIDECAHFFNHLKLTDQQNKIAKRLLVEIKSRLGYLMDVGLPYLTLNRPSSTLSGGESQRINLATSLGSSLIGSMYILDEPSIGLHPKDGARLIKVLRSLQDIGNTVIVVEHDDHMMKASDYILDMGPMAGRLGGELVFAGDHKALKKAKNSITADYLTGKKEISIPETRRSSKYAVELKGARENNLKNVDVSFPLNTITAVTGVSGSGKSTLVRKILYPALKKYLKESAGRAGEHTALLGDLKHIDGVEMVDQNPIGKSSRSNPATYVKAYDDIRSLYTQQQLSKINGYKPSHFSLNVSGGRCDACEGLGQVVVSMQFMADVYLKCEACNGMRFKEDILEVKFKDKHIVDILNMTVDEAVEFFGAVNSRACQKIVEKIQCLQDVGLGYIQLGQSSNTLSGGEAQRVKLASFLSKGNSLGRQLFIFDEPTTGLHVHDIRHLLAAFNSLVDNGHTVIVIEHHGDIIKNADWVIDLGPEGGINGGNVIFEGTPEKLIKCKESATGEFLKEDMA